MARRGPFLQFALSINKYRTYISATIAFDAFIHVMQPVIVPLLFAHLAYLFQFDSDGFLFRLSGCGTRLCLLGVDAAHSGRIGVFLFACTHAITTLDTFDFVDSDAFDPKLTIVLNEVFRVWYIYFSAKSTAGTLFGVNVAGFSVDFDGEVAGSALDAFKVGVGYKLDVKMPAGFDQFG